MTLKYSICNIYQYDSCSRKHLQTYISKHWLKQSKQQQDNLQNNVTVPFNNHMINKQNCCQINEITQARESLIVYGNGCYTMPLVQLNQSEVYCTITEVLQWFHLDKRRKFKIQPQHHCLMNFLRLLLICHHYVAIKASMDSIVILSHCAKL